MTLTHSALMMEAARTSETSVNFYQTARRYNPEDSHLHTRLRENLKSHQVTNTFPNFGRPVPFNSYSRSERDSTPGEIPHLLSFQLLTLGGNCARSRPSY
jgi:hypothetical protein